MIPAGDTFLRESTTYRRARIVGMTRGPGLAPCPTVPCRKDLWKGKGGTAFRAAALEVLEGLPIGILSPGWKWNRCLQKECWEFVL